MNITLDALEALDAIDRAGTFAGAARRLNKAQSAVSYGVKLLEGALGQVIFDRSGHRAVLTDVGRAVLEEAREVLARAQRLETLGRRFGAGHEPRLSIVVDGILPMGPIMRALKRLAAEGVPTRIQLKMEFLGGVQDRFEADAADMMLVKDYTPGAHLVAVPLEPVEVLLVTAADHPLAPAAGLGLVDLHAHVELTVHDSSTSKRLADTHLFGGSRVFYLSDFNTKLQGLRMGLGFGWMPRYLVADDLEAGRLVVLDYAPGPRFVFTPALVHPVARPLGLTGRRLRDLLTGLASTPPDPL